MEVTHPASDAQVSSVLIAQFPIDHTKLEEHFDNLFFARWDVDGTGFISREEFLHPERGLLNFVVRRPTARTACTDDSTRQRGWPEGTFIPTLDVHRRSPRSGECH